VDFTKLVGISGSEKVKPLGSLVWFTIRETRVRREQVEKAFEELELPERLLPPPIRPVDAFRRATSLVRKKRAKGQKEGEFINVLVTESYSDENEVVRHITREVVDSEDRRLSYAECARAILDKKTGELTLDKRTDIPEEHECDEIIRAVRENYEDCTTFYGSRQIRGVVRELVKSEMQGELLRESGALYFVPEKHRELLKKTKQLIDILNGDSPVKSRLADMPVMDAGDVRELVEEKMTGNTLEELEELNEELGELLKKDVRPQTAARFAGRINTLRDKVATYEELLGKRLKELNEKAEELAGKARALFSKTA